MAKRLELLFAAGVYSVCERFKLELSALNKTV